MVTTCLLQKHSANMEENSVPKRNELWSVVELRNKTQATCNVTLSLTNDKNGDGLMEYKMVSTNHHWRTSHTSQDGVMLHRKNTHPAQALHTDVIGIGATRRAINHPILELIVGCVSCHSAEELTAVLH